MTSDTYYPSQRHLLSRTTIRRERFLPESGEITVSPGVRVAMHDVVGHGASPAPYILIEAARELRLKDPDKLFDLLEVRIGEQVSAGEPLASLGRRGRRLLAPVDAQVIDVAQGRIVLQELSAPLELEAFVNGTVVSVRRGRSVVIEAYGGVLQGVWGSNRRAIGTIRQEPSSGLENIFGNVIDAEYRGAVVVTRRTLKAVSFQVIEDQSFSAVIAPSMEPDLIDLALDTRAAILLTEGFGSRRMSNVVAQFLETMEGRQATVDALVATGPPEVLIAVPLQPAERPLAPNLNATLQVGREVRLERGPFAGMVGHVIRLPKEPVSLDNGLKVPCAQVQLITGEKTYVPVANIEVFGS